MGKKKGRQSRQSKGIQGGARSHRVFDPAQRILRQQEAWLKGKRVMLVIDDAGHKAEAQTVWGLPPMLQKKGRNES
jgi:hypothetical protein